MKSYHAYTVETFNGKILGVWFTENEAINYLENFPSSHTFIGYHTKEVYNTLKNCNML
jgi:hypothetical protein